MSRTHYLLLVACLLMAMTGCRNRCNSQCGNGLFAGSPTIAAPPTYSLNIPSVARNQPYYVPGTNSTLNSNSNAPTPANQTNQLNGWQPANGNGTGTNGASNSGSNGQSVLSSPTIFANNTTPDNFRTASNTALPGSGMSYRDSTNYQTTRVDETLDRTRLAATDASNVRAPARNYPTGEMQRLAQLPPPNDPRYPNTFNAPASTGQPYVGGLNNGQPVYLGTPIVAGNGAYGNNPIVYGGQLYAPPQQRYTGMPMTGSSNAVLAQSTTTFDASNGGTQLGWRDREISGRDSFSR